MDADGAASGVTTAPGPPETPDQTPTAPLDPDPARAAQTSSTKQSQGDDAGHIISDDSDEVAGSEDTAGARRRKKSGDKKQGAKKKQSILLRIDHWKLVAPQKSPLWQYFGKYGPKAPQKYSNLSVCRLCLENQSPCEFKMGKAMSTSSMCKPG